ncbi:MFS transporter [Streptomyces sp. NBC_01089]|uniref:MFS transporter n=1 Tax=Streptomyces sp. NBC_01089 TaxID=2903747 RepID=UPI00386E37AE|nr:MFS transporter [Streptomyces sp. NBC_01089]
MATAFAVLMTFGTVPTPLWQLYAARDHFGATMVTVAYASMVVGAVGAFLGLGHLSDRLGRRRVVAPALAIGIIASVVMITWQSLPGLIVGRVLTGLAMGTMASTATTYLHDLHRRARPEQAGSPLPGIVATAANLGGLAAGPLVAGIVAQWLPAPLTIAPALCSVALTVCLLLVLATPETVDRKPRTSRPAARFALRPGSGVAFGAAGMLGANAFANFGLTSALGSKVLQDTLRIDSHLVAGVAVFLMFASAAAAQLVLGRLPLPRILRLGCLAFPTGLALCAYSLNHPALWLYLVAVSLSGAGSGLLFKGAIDRAMSAAAPDSRAGVLAVYFVIAYIGIGVPAIIFSIAIDHIGIEAAMIGFASVLSLGAAVSTAVASHNRNKKA